MAIEQCAQCFKQFDRIGPNRVCFNCMEAERKSYQKLYKKISPALHRLDFLKMAEACHQDPKRLRDVLHFRLGTGGSHHELHDVKKTVCYLCHHKMENLENLEPLCLACVKPLADFAESRKTATAAPSAGSEQPSVHFPTRKFKSDATPEGSSESASRPADGGYMRPAYGGMANRPPEPVPVSNPGQCLCCRQPVPVDSICVRCFEVVSTEVHWFRNQFGAMPAEEQAKVIPGGQALSPEKINKVIQHQLAPDFQALSKPADGTVAEAQGLGEEPLVTEAVASSAQETDPLDAENVDDFLKILEMDESDPAWASLANLEDELDIAFISPADLEHIRKFGFKRLKYK